jgi:Flp pilus assembly protein TadD
MRQFDESETILRRLLSIREDDPLVHRAMGCMAMDRMMPQKALHHFQRMAELAPHNPEANTFLAAAREQIQKRATQ